MTDRDNGLALEALAEQLRNAYNGDLLPPISDDPSLNTPDDAYAIQSINTSYWQKTGRRITGRKIGLTSKVVQSQLKVDQPDFGVLFADMEYSDYDEIPIETLQQPRIEAEIAFILKKDLINPNPSLAEIVSAIEFALPALEIVSSRIADWKITFEDTVADNASAGAYILGGAPRRIDELDLFGCRMILKKGDEIVSEGDGRSCLGNPLNAVRWLANKSVSVGAPLKAGEVVLSGALGAMTSVQAGDHFSAFIDGLGEVSAHFTHEVGHGKDET
ncbi:MAG: fumarylacetoacetate hydrolase family protein [Parvibaculaceae bacterium]